MIQFGAILAIVWEYRRKIGSVVGGLPTQPKARRFALNVIIATIPAVVLGLLFEKHIKAVLFAPVPVAVALIVGGIVILWAEARHRERDVAPRVTSVDDLSYADAFKVGLAQCFALIPGTSRSGSTIIGGMLFGLERKVATEFSFFLAIPIIFGATLYELAKEWRTLSVDSVGLVYRRAGGCVCQRVHVYSMAAALRRHARFHGVRVVSDRLWAADPDRRV